MRPIKPHKTFLRGRELWRVIIPPDDENPKRVQKWYKTEEEASAEAKRINEQRFGGRIEELYRINRTEQAMLVAALQKAGSAAAVLDAVTLHAKPIQPKKLREAIDELISDREQANLSREYVAQLKWTFASFKFGRSEVLLSKIGVADVRAWLKEVGGTPDVQRAYVTRLRTLFSFGMHESRRWCATNPAKGVSMPGRAGSEPVIFDVDECQALVDAAAKLDKEMLGYFGLCLFAGMRPSEARRLQKENIRGEIILVTKSVARKVKEVRNIPIEPALRACIDAGGLVPVPRDWKKRFQAIRKASGVTWHNDAMRHTYATMTSRTHGWEEAVRRAGHSLAMLVEHYQAMQTRGGEPVTKEMAESFWKIRPEK